MLVAVAAAAACNAVAGAPRPQVVGCGQAVFGSVGDWRAARSSVVAGHAGWPYLVAFQQSRSSYGPHRGLAAFVKGLFVVEPAHVVTVRIPASEQRRLSLYYAATFEPRAQWHDTTWFRVSDGAAAITFRACPRGRNPGWTQFAGGFMVRGPQCALVEVRARGSARWLRRRIPFGKGTCG